MASDDDYGVAGQYTYHWRGEAESPTLIGPVSYTIIAGGPGNPAISFADRFYVFCLENVYSEGMRLDWGGSWQADMEWPGGLGNYGPKGAWGHDGDDIWLVGNDGIILRKQGGGSWGWQQVASSTSADLRGIHGRAADDIYAVGYNKVIHWDGNSWQNFAGGSPEAATLIAVYCSTMDPIGAAPYVINKDPYPNEEDVEKDADISFSIISNYSQVQLSSILIWINGELVYRGNSDWFMRGWQKSGYVANDQLGFDFSIRSSFATRFESGSEVTVRVYAEDAEGAWVNDTWTFNVADKPFLDIYKFIIRGARKMDEGNN
jgi:hypothetical protein